MQFNKFKRLSQISTDYLQPFKSFILIYETREFKNGNINVSAAERKGVYVSSYRNTDKLREKNYV